MDNNAPGKKEARRQYDAILVVAQLPPPINGLSLISANVVGHLRSLDGLTTRSINISPPIVGSKARSSLRALRCLYGFAACLTVLATWKLAGRRAALYITPSGGAGKWIEIPFVLLAKLFRTHTIYHHHSFAYLNNRSASANFIFNFLGGNDVHIALGARMAGLLRERYSTNDVRVISNAAFVPTSPERALAPGRALRIGYLGNISIDKGILLFIDTIKTLNDSGIMATGIVAGPFAKPEEKSRIINHAADGQNLKFIGGVYGEQKKDFLDNLDFLLFPTKYVNEAEPVTVLEALACGVPVLATDRGGIRDILSGELSPCLLDADRFVELAAATISTIIGDDRLTELRAAARRRHAAMHTEANNALHGTFA